MKNYIDRIIDKEIERYLRVMGGVLLTGPKLCGKTTTAKQHVNSILKLDDIEKRDVYLKLAEIKPSELLKGEKPRLIDEWQLAPILWDGVRNSVDEENKKGLYILTGSTSVDEDKIKHSAIGRIHRLSMYPMSLYESGDSNGNISLIKLFENPEKDISGINSDLTFDDLLFVICRGGWPESVTIDDKEDQLLIAKAYFQDLCASGLSDIDEVNRDPEKLRYLSRSYARNISTIAKDTTIMSDITEEFGEISKGTYYSYIKALKKAYIIRNIHAWSPNIRSASSMKATTKKEFIDPSFATAALNLTPKRLLQEPNTLDFIFETLSIRDLRIYSDMYGGEIYYFRKNSLEIDCLLVLDDGRYALIEFKLGSREIEKGAKNLIKVKNLIKKEIENGRTKIQEPSFLAVVYGGNLAYNLDDGVKVIPISCLKD